MGILHLVGCKESSTQGCFPIILSCSPLTCATNMLQCVLSQTTSLLLLFLALGRFCTCLGVEKGATFAVNRILCCVDSIYNSLPERYFFSQAPALCPEVYNSLLMPVVFLFIIQLFSLQTNPKLGHFEFQIQQ